MAPATLLISLLLNAVLASEAFVAVRMLRLGQCSNFAASFVPVSEYLITEGVNFTDNCVEDPASFHASMQGGEYEMIWADSLTTACYERARGYSPLLEARLSSPCKLLRLCSTACKQATMVLLQCLTLSHRLQCGWLAQAA